MLFPPTWPTRCYCSNHQLVNCFCSGIHSSYAQGCTHKYTQNQSLDSLVPRPDPKKKMKRPGLPFWICHYCTLHKNACYGRTCLVSSSYIYQLVIMVIKTNLEPKRGFFQTGPGNKARVWELYLGVTSIAPCSDNIYHSKHIDCFFTFSRGMRMQLLPFLELSSLLPNDHSR